MYPHSVAVYVTGSARHPLFPVPVRCIKCDCAGAATYRVPLQSLAMLLCK